MANILKREKQVAAISGLAEGLSIRSVERITGIHHFLKRLCSNDRSSKMEGLDEKTPPDP